MIEFNDGDEVRLKDGRVGVIYDINPNPRYIQDDEYYAEFEQSNNRWAGGQVEEAEDVVEVIRTRKQLAERDIPSVDEIANYVSSALHSGWGDINVYESIVEGDGWVTVYGNRDGLEFSFMVQVTELEAVFN